jgi:hypothetical protein
MPTTTSRMTLVDGSQPLESGKALFFFWTNSTFIISSK